MWFLFNYSQVPIKRVGWEKVRVGWRGNTFFLSLCLSFCMLPYSHFFHPTRLFGTWEYVDSVKADVRTLLLLYRKVRTILQLRYFVHWPFIFCILVKFETKLYVKMFFDVLFLVQLGNIWFKVQIFWKGTKFEFF